MLTRGFKLLCLLFLMCSLPGVAQLSNSGIKGTVRDAANSILPGAEVTLINSGTGSKQVDHANREGYFDFPALAPGNYEVSVTSEGFSEWSGKLTLRVAQTATINAIMRPASAQTTVDVVDVTPVIDRADATISDVKEAARIETLPMQNRNFLNILNFSAGVVSNSFAGQGSGYTRVNGIPGGSIDYLVDGQTASERFTNELQRTPQPLPTIQELKVTTSNGSAEYSRPGMVEVVTKSGTNQLHGQLFELNKISALQAHTMNQAGPNNFLVRNEFGGNLGGPVVIPHLYNGKDKTFFFIDIEGIRQRSAADARYTVPNPNWKTGDFSDFYDSSGVYPVIYDPLSTTYDPATTSYVRTPFQGNRIPAERINPIAKKIMEYIPDPNQGNAPYYDGPNYHIPNLRAKDDSTLITAKLDQMIGKNRLSARYTYTKQDTFSAGYFLNNRINQRGGHNGALSYTYIITPNLVNETRIGVQRFHSYGGPEVISPPITETLGLPTYPGTIAWPSFYFDDAYSYNFDGIDRDNPKDSPNTAINFGDNLTWNKGKHSVKFGFAYQFVAVTTSEVGQPGGDYNFSGLFTAQMDPAQAALGTHNAQIPHTGAGLADFLLGETDYAGLNQYPLFHTRQGYYAGFVQDDWRVTPTLTLNLGLRYEYWTPFKDNDGRASTLDLTTAGGPTVIYPGSGSPNVDPAVFAAYQAGGLQFKSAADAGFPKDLWNMDKTSFAPRIGIAYQVDTKTVFRGGYGLYYWAMPLVQYHQNTRKNAPFSYSYVSNVDDTNNSAAELTFPAGAPTYTNQSPTARTLGNAFINPSSLAITESSGWKVLPWDVNFHPQRVQQWNLTLERELPAHLGARISYVGNHSDHLVMFDPINALKPRAQSVPGATDQQRRAYPHFATSNTSVMDLIRYNGYANTNMLQTELKQQVNSDMIVQGFFVWQRVLTTSEGSNNAFTALEMQPAALTNNAPDDQRLRPLYAHDSGIPQYTFSFNTHYVLPFGRNKKFLNKENGFVDRVVSGWNVSAFYYWRSGLYFSPYYASGQSNYTLVTGKDGTLPKSQRNRDHWFDPSAYVLKSNTLDYDLLSNIPRTSITGPGFNNMDVTVSKITPIADRVTLNLEAQIFNIYNHVSMALPNNSGAISTQVGNQRQVQLQGKIVF